MSPMISPNLDPTVEQALKRFDIAEEAYSKIRMESREDLRFVAGEQWLQPPGSDELRLTVNLLNPFLRQITAEARDAPPAIKVIPVAEADVDGAAVRQGLIRHIEQKCDAMGVYQKAMWYAAAGGEGYILLDSEYCSDDSFDQDLVIKLCNNPEKVFLDPSHELPDGCDSDWGFIIEDMSVDSYKRQFPKSKLAQSFDAVGWDRLALPGDWVSAHTVRVAKYWVKEYTSKTIYLVYDPVADESITVDEKPDDNSPYVLQKSREVQVPKVKCYLLNATEVLSEMDWPGKYIPIIKVTGDEYYVAGEKHTHGAIRFAKDPQRQYNYFTSRQTEMVDLAPKNSFVGATGQFANNPEKWANANRVNYGFLDYNPIDVKGVQVPPPTRVSGLDMQAFSGVLQSRMSSLEDLKLVFGLHDAALGRQGNEISGVAITNRMSQSKKSTYQYYDNLLIAIKCLGRQIVDLIPFFYDTPRMIRIVKPDNTEQLVAINELQSSRYDLTKGTYDVIVETGPAFATKRQEAFDALNGIMGTLPGTGQVIGDLVASQVDSPIAKLAAKRIRATIPKEILAATGENNTEDMAPAELVEQLQMELAQLTKQMEMLDLEKQELEVKVRIAEDKSALELTRADMEHQREMAHLQHQDELSEVEARIKLKQLQLQERQLDLKERELQIHATMAASKVNESIPRIKDVDISNEADIGGKLD